MPVGRLSLHELMYGYLYGFAETVRRLWDEIDRAAEIGAADKDRLYAGGDLIRLEILLQRVARDCVVKLGLTAAGNRLERIASELRRGAPSCSFISRELRVLDEAIEDDIKRMYFYHYPVGREAPDGKWESVVAAHPGAKDKLEAAFDCLDRADYAGCVFHMLRVAELGEGALNNNFLAELDCGARDDLVGHLRALEATRKRLLGTQFIEADALLVISQVREFMSGRGQGE
jgi:hypothetical protein